MRLIKYLVQYRFRDMGDLLRNEKKDPIACEADLKGKNVVISGATAGIGLETARLFAQKGANLICLNRNLVKSKNLEKELKEKYACNVRTILVNFESLEQVKKAANELLALEEPIDILIHNTGVYYTTKTFTKEDIEIVFQVNHLGSFLLNYLLKDRIQKENRARIIYVNSEGHRFALAGVHLKDLAWKWHIYAGLKSYGAAKTAQLLTMYKFADFFKNSAVTINAMHPGNVKTNIGTNNGKLYQSYKNKFVLTSAREPVVAAQALLYLATSEKLKDSSGGFYNLTSREKPAPHARDLSAVDAVWQKSLELCGLV